MATYNEQLAKRKQAAADAEAELVAHFGPDANNCANWDDLWQRNWLRILTNSSISKLPNTLPSAGGWVSENGRQAGADPPSLYSDKFLFYFARQLADDRTELVVRANKLLTGADEMDCDLFTQAIETVTVCLSSPALHVIQGQGYSMEMRNVTTTQIDELFRSWGREDAAAGLYINRLGIAIGSKRVVPAEVAAGKLQVVSRQIEVRRQQLLDESARVEGAQERRSNSRLPNVKKKAKLAPGISAEQVRHLLESLKIGSTYSKPGEWVAAFRALHIAKVLVGNAPEMARWAEENGCTPHLLLATFKKVWLDDWNEANQFTNKDQKTVFRNVSAGAMKLLQTQNHSD